MVISLQTQLRSSQADCVADPWVSFCRFSHHTHLKASVGITLKLDGSTSLEFTWLLKFKISGTKIYHLCSCKQPYLNSVGHNK